MKILVIVGLGAALATACATSGPTTPVPDASLGLVKGSVFDTPTPPAVKANESNPGEQPPLPRPYVIAPPRIPHATTDFLPITAKQNACFDCHAVKEKKPGEPTPIPPSHYVDLRNVPGQAGTRLSGARYVCVSCHAVTTGAGDLVESRFGR